MTKTMKTAEEMKVNAQLIAAAPELLDALIELVKINKTKLEGAASWSLCKPWFKKLSNATEEAEKVINKALGL